MLTEQEKLEVQKEALQHVDLCKKLFNVEVSPNVPSPPKLACVYAFEMSNNLIKIGMTQKVGERKKGVNNFLSVKRIHHTEFAPLPFIREIESICHRAFADRRVRGEYFNITFEEAVAELDRHAQKIAEVFRAADKKYLEKIIYFYEDFLPKYEKKVEMSEAELPEVVTVEGVRGYLDDEGTAYLNVEDIARGLGFVQVHGERVTENGRTYVAVRWDRVNKYRAEFDLKPVKAGDFIPENEFYLLAMKANNEMAKKFQLEVANKILPSIRKTGYYVSEMTPPVSVVDLTDLTERVARIELLFDKMIEALESIKNSAEKQMTKEQRGRELVALADKLAPSPEKQKILLHAANLINGKKIF